MAQDIGQVDPTWAWSQYKPEQPTDWNKQLVAHLYRRAGFGATHDQLKLGLELSPVELVDSLTKQPTEQVEFTTSANGLARTVVAAGDPKQLAAAWMYRLLYTPDQLLEKLTLFWHGHFATGAEKVMNAELMWNQNTLLREHALGNFESLVQGISQDPAMLIYLDSITNRKAHPNENYARELMELFCLGEGNYSERDVQEVARCFTGWEIKNKQFRKNSYQHDNEQKRFLGRVGNFDGEDAVTIVLEQPAMAYFVIGKWVRYYVMDEPQMTRQLLDPLAAEFRDNGFQIAPIIKRILTSQLFYSKWSLNRKVRSPIELFVGCLRSLQATTNTVQLAARLTELGHGLFYPPNVKGWDGGRAWINSSTLLGRANLMREVLDSDSTQFAGGKLEELVSRLGLGSAEEILNWMCEMLLAVPLDSEIARKLLMAYDMSKKPRELRLRDLLHTLSALPEFHLC